MKIGSTQGRLALLLIAATLSTIACETPPPQASTSGVKAASTKVQTGSDGLTIEQRNIKERLVEDNKPGAIKHLYVISAYSGQVLIYSTVRGKVTSSAKRLAPSDINTRWCGGNNSNDGSSCADGFGVDIGGHTYVTKQVLGDDGTYGSSVEYIYWWDSVGIYHQHYVQGGQIVHVASEPLAVKSIVLNLETRQVQP